MIEYILQKGESFLYLAVSLLLGWIGWSVKTRFVPREEHNKLAARVDHIESAMAHLPSAKEINALRAQLSEVSSDLKVFNQRHIATEAKIDRVQLQLDRMDAYLREKTK